MYMQKLDFILQASYHFIANWIICIMRLELKGEFFFVDRKSKRTEQNIWVLSMEKSWEKAKMHWIMFILNILKLAMEEPKQISIHVRVAIRSVHLSNEYFRDRLLLLMPRFVHAMPEKNYTPKKSDA